MRQNGTEKQYVRRKMRCKINLFEILHTSILKKDEEENEVPKTDETFIDFLSAPGYQIIVNI
ncbi:hypothetical protein HMPREF1870_01536 [Bacteroidales bacterium KA00344]|nr:hypothetical protein HMPREF1870_01536 [Bacteroidales bacterium KA00344]